MANRQVEDELAEAQHDMHSLLETEARLRNAKFWENEENAARYCHSVLENLDGSPSYHNMAMEALGYCEDKWLAALAMKYRANALSRVILLRKRAHNKMEQKERAVEVARAVVTGKVTLSQDPKAKTNGGPKYNDAHRQEDSPKASRSTRKPPLGKPQTSRPKPRYGIDDRFPSENNPAGPSIVVLDQSPATTPKASRTDNVPPQKPPQKPFVHQNHFIMSARSKSKYAGVSWEKDRKCWRTKFGGATIFRGETKQEACEAYANAYRMEQRYVQKKQNGTISLMDLEYNVSL